MQKGIFKKIRLNTLQPPTCINQKLKMMHCLHSRLPFRHVSLRASEANRKICYHVTSPFLSGMVLSWMEMQMDLRILKCQQCLGGPDGQGLRHHYRYMFEKTFFRHLNTSKRCAVMTPKNAVFPSHLWLRGTPGYRNKGISSDRFGVDNSKNASKNWFCAIFEF